jgi:hypothetical protein
MERSLRERPLLRPRSGRGRTTVEADRAAPGRSDADARQRRPVGVAARSVDVSPRTLRRWMHEGDLRERVSEISRSDPLATLPEVDDRARDEAQLVVLILRASEHDWRASAWWLERRYPERWGAERMET